MRVIAGSARSMPLKTVKNLNTRPTSDKLKETLFNILSPHIDGAKFLDLFAGSGAIGIEALSRGATAATFVEKAIDAYKVINENLVFTKFIEKSKVVRGDVISSLRKLNEKKEKFDIIFLDPPYDKKIYDDVLKELSVLQVDEKNAIVVIEDVILKEVKENDIIYSFKVFRIKEYNGKCHIFLERVL